MYFTDRLYSHKELPSDYKKRISEESKAAPTKPLAMADRPAPVPARSGDQSHRKEADKQIIGDALQTTAAGQDYMRGIQSILNSIEKEPLTLWKKEVSVYKTSTLWNQLVWFFVLQTFPIINVITTVLYLDYNLL